MKLLNNFLILTIILFSATDIYSQTNDSKIKNALFIAENNKKELENVNQLLVVYNYKPENFMAVFVALEKKENKWIVKQPPIEAGIGKKGFALPQDK
jgi:hypothetical protein